MIRTASFLERVFVVLAAAASPSAAQMNLKNCGFNRKDGLPFRMTFFVNFQCSGPAQFLREVWSKYSRDPPSVSAIANIRSSLSRVVLESGIIKDEGILGEREL